MLSSVLTLFFHCCVILGKESDRKWEEEQITKKEGKEEGRVIGKQEQAIETCKRMLANPVYTLQMIQELTGFTEEEIQKIQKEFKDK